MVAYLTVPRPLTAIPRGFEAEVSTGRMPYLSPKQQRQKAQLLLRLPIWV